MGIETSASPRIADFWLHHEHNGFTPNSRAPVHEEIRRLADSRGWSHSTMMKRREEALAAEITLHDDGKDRLERWQQLCVEVGAAGPHDVPRSMSGCKKVSLKTDSKAMCRSVLLWLTRSQALRKVRVNICNLVDHRRNPQTIHLLRFDSYCALSLYTRGVHVFPKLIAKRNGALRGLLREI
jgi:hypothetical protein